ncbi:hypothetical protein TIFTF001_006246 [Ficus carica]|uniref:Uncharacterized protein n=1 Tax=Ficus carica TaxID=3494 RepID=A0AA88CVT6_FICCA|nr:hypothetical protein TIFTF001_006246 [Ficus carica]
MYSAVFRAGRSPRAGPLADHLPRARRNRHVLGRCGAQSTWIRVVKPALLLYLSAIETIPLLLQHITSPTTATCPSRIYRQRQPPPSVPRSDRHCCPLAGDAHCVLLLATPRATWHPSIGLVAPAGLPIHPVP